MPHGRESQVSLTSRETKSPIIVLLGYDGAGKSSVLENLLTEGYPTSCWEDLSAVPQLEYVSRGLSSPSVFEGLPPHSRAAFLLSAIVAEFDFIIEPTARKAGFVVVDSYYLRPIAKDLVRGRSTREILHLAFLLPRPEIVILFDLPAEEAFRRKGNLSRHEVFLQPTKEDFCSFQEHVLEVALGMVEPHIVQRIDARRTRQEVYGQVREIVDSYKAQKSLQRL